MEDIRQYRDEEQEKRLARKEEGRREEREAIGVDEEVPFHIPRD